MYSKVIVDSHTTSKQTVFNGMNVDYIRNCWTDMGMVPHTFELANKAVIPYLLDDMPMYLTEVKRNRADELFRIPYLLTEAIIKAAHDPHVLEVASAILGTDELVMWGPNLQTGTPNEAYLWHTDVEAWLWPSVSVFIGLEGCLPENSTKCIPGSFRLPCQPWFAANNTSDQATIEAARKLGESNATIQQFDGFGDGRFYVFNAKCWHAGHREISTNRKLLFIHYDKASNYRMPYMKNYIERTWFDYPAIYIPVNHGNESFYVNRKLHSIDGKNYNGVLPEGFQFID